MLRTAKCSSVEFKYLTPKHARPINNRDAGSGTVAILAEAGRKEPGLKWANAGYRDIED